MTPLQGPGDVVIWDDTCPAEYVSDEADEWFSTMLGMKCRWCTCLIQQAYYRPTLRTGGSITSFSDGYPYLVIVQAFA